MGGGDGRWSVGFLGRGLFLAFWVGGDGMKRFGPSKY